MSTPPRRGRHRRAPRRGTAPRVRSALWLLIQVVLVLLRG
ncbi:hypothetical protein JOE68_002477 [Saccharothrix algeriensis]|uniref:Uncharacterized protein n=1 Tax=Saccharothrix algeriensis TaxID=173560 RepID=A0ABS2S5V7_9PSEU|nr:hypothetical protein [Saccharothrix algeriensis]